MKIQELPARAYLAHLRRHPVPELMDEECLAALANVEAQFGDTITHGAGLEVRLGNPARFVDYIMCVDQDYVPGIQCIWYEIDYADYLRGGEISPCLFINTSDYKEEKADEPEHTAAEDDNVQRQEKPFVPPMGKKFWDSVLPPFAGEKRAARLRGQLDRVLAALPPNATIKQIGTMSPRGELDILRLVVIFHQWESIFAWLRDVGWPGDTGAMEQALLPWKEAQGFAVNIDLSESGLLEKTGLEVFGRWRHPLLVDKFIERLEDAGLCLPSKGAALRRWIRILPDGESGTVALYSSSLFSALRAACPPGYGTDRRNGCSAGGNGAGPDPGMRGKPGARDPVLQRRNLRAAGTPAEGLRCGRPPCGSGSGPAKGAGTGERSAAD